ncbi:MAG: response regulator [Pseudomonadota bacterium]
MQTSDLVRSQLPFLRRYARALSGSQQIGDRAVKATLEGILTGSVSLDTDEDGRVALYRAFHRRWPDLPAAQTDDANKSHTFADPAALKQHLDRFAPLKRQAFLLSALEEFSNAEVALILDLKEFEVEKLVQQAAADVANIESERILVIEDEMLIALDLKDMVETLGHEVIEIVHNHQEAVRAAKEHKPGLILADIKLARDSSGIEAVAEILASFAVPVVFVTAFPERLLTGEQIEPAFLVTKPFQPESIRAALSQALSCRGTPEVV